MAKKATELVLVLDRSGSMSATKDDAEGGLREFVKKQRKVPGKGTLTFYRFDTENERVFEDKPLKSVEDAELVLEPRGGTALLDAIGRAINDVEARHKKFKRAYRPNVIFLFVTDGQENSSREFTRGQVFKMIDDKRAEYDWDFVFVGSNQDAIAEGSSLGISVNSALNYGSKSHWNSYQALGSAVARSRTMGGAVCFTADERDLSMTEDE